MMHHHRLRFTRKLAAVIALESFLLIFALWSTGTHMMNGGRDCMLAKLQSTNCAGIIGSEAITFHLSAFARFISGAFISSFVLLIVLFAIVLAVAVAEKVPRHPPGIAQALDHSSPPVLRQLTHWLSLLVISPPSLIFGRV